MTAEARPPRPLRSFPLSEVLPIQESRNRPQSERLSRSPEHRESLASAPAFRFPRPNRALFPRPRAEPSVPAFRTSAPQAHQPQLQDQDLPLLLHREAVRRSLSRSARELRELLPISPSNRAHRKFRLPAHADAVLRRSWRLTPDLLHRLSSQSFQDLLSARRIPNLFYVRKAIRKAVSAHFSVFPKKPLPKARQTPQSSCRTPR